MYLPPDAQDRLFDNITALSASGKQAGHRGLLQINDINEQELRRRMRRRSEMLEPPRLRARHGRPGVFRRTHRYEHVSVRPRLADRHRGHQGPGGTCHGLPPIDDDDLVFGDIVYVSAELKTTRKGTRIAGEPWARSDRDTWDLASSVGATATMVAARPRAGQRGEPNPIINDPFAAPLVRTVGARLLPSAWSTARSGPADGSEQRTLAARDRFDRRAHPLLRRLLPERRRDGVSPSRDSGRRPRRTRLPAGMAGR